VKSVIGRRRIAAAALGVTIALVAAACGGNNTTTGSAQQSGSAQAGGTLREELPEFGWTNNFDPTGEYLGYAWGLFDQLLMRGLYTYKHTPADQGGDTPVPDLITGDPTVSDDGLTYDFTLKDNVKWAPPLTRVVTANDILYAFQRINDAKEIAQYGNYYCGVIVGMDCKAKDDNQPISGIKVTDDTHLSITLEQPTGDLAYRLAMPATKAVHRVPRMFPEGRRHGCRRLFVGPVRDHGSGRPRRHVVQRDQAAQRVRRGQGHDPSTQPELRPEHGRHPFRVRRRDPVEDQHQRRQHLQRPARR